MRRLEWTKQAISAGNDFHAVKQVPWKHNALNVSALLLVCLLFAGVMGLGAVLPTWLYIPLGALLMGCLVFSLFVLVVHECSHGMFLLLEDKKQVRKLNNVVGTLFGDILFTDYMSHWAREHTVHHLKPMEAEDRQDGLRLSGKHWWKMVAFLMLPGAPLVINPSRQYGFDLRRTLTGMIFWCSLAVIGATMIHWQVAVAVLFSFNVTGCCNINKIAQEHGSNLIRVVDPCLRSRTYFYGLRLLTSPFNINYHFEHHANFNVPWYLLPRYHRRVMELMPADMKPYFLTRGWTQFWSQVAGTRALPPVALTPLASEDTDLHAGILPVVPVSH